MYWTSVIPWSYHHWEGKQTNTFLFSGVTGRLCLCECLYLDSFRCCSFMKAVFSGTSNATPDATMVVSRTAEQQHSTNFYTGPCYTNPLQCPHDGSCPSSNVMESTHGRGRKATLPTPFRELPEITLLNEHNIVTASFQKLSVAAEIRDYFT